MPKIITIGSALVDIFIHSSHFQISQDEGVAMLCQRFGEKLEVEGFEVHTGGGGTNTAVGFRRLGFETAVVAETGRDAFSQLIDADLHSEQVKTDLLIRERKEQTGGSVIMVGQNGGRTVMVHRGAAAQLGIEDLPQAALAEADWVHLSSCGGQLEFLTSLFKLIRESSVGLSWNPGRTELAMIGRQVSVSELPVKVLLLNAEEWASVAEYQDQLKNTIPEIVVTDGDQGGLVYANHTDHHFAAKQVQSVDDTGAGDAFAVGYVSARLLNKSVTQATAWGVTNATSVVQHTGAKPGLLNRNDLETM